MEFNDKGGAFLLEIPSVGKDVSVEVPWDVATAWRGTGESSQDDLKDWLQHNQARFEAMIEARFDPQSIAAKDADDPRVVAVEQLRHI